MVTIDLKDGLTMRVLQNDIQIWYGAIKKKVNISPVSAIKILREIDRSVFPEINGQLDIDAIVGTITTEKFVDQKVISLRR